MLPLVITAPARLAGNFPEENDTMVNNVLRFLRRFFRAQEAVSALEYAILVGVIVAGVGGALLVFSGSIEKAVSGIGDKVAKVETKKIEVK